MNSKTFSMIPVVLLPFAAVSAFANMNPPVPNSQTTSDVLTIPAERFVKVRCATDGSETFYQWHGKLYANIPGEKQRFLFTFVGMNAARCFRDSLGNWKMSSREMQLYLDATTGLPVHRWNNPWTKETLPVVHVANNPVQIPYGQNSFSAYPAGIQAVLGEDVTLTYPNPLATNSAMSEYAPDAFYQSIEMFKFYTFKSLVAKDIAAPFISQVAISWTRTGQWLPWMKMGNRPGNLVYSAWGERKPSFEYLTDMLRSEINTRAPLYRHAPTCWLKSKNETSWTYFARNFEQFKNGDRFPIEAPAIDDDCAQ
jgi:hypothetical protein